MSKHDKLLRRILGGASDANISFHDLCGLLLNMGFEKRVRSSHHLFFKEGIEEFLNIQESKGKAKAYQVRQIRDYLIRHGLGVED
jgi:hypothetical protein